MAGSAYDGTLEALGGEQAAPAPAPTTNPFDATLQEMTTAGQVRLRRSFADAGETTPDTAAEARRLSLKLGVPAPVIARNLDVYRKRDALEKPYSQIQRETPKLASWLEDPANASVAHDDLEHLGFLEWLVTAPQRAFAQTLNQEGFATLRYQSMFRDLTQAEHDQLESYRYQIDHDKALGTGTSWFRKAITGTAGFLANQVPIAKAAGAGSGLGAAAAIGVGLAAGPEAAVLGIAASALPAIGGSVGALYGVLHSTFQQEAGNAYDEYLGMRDEFGRALDPAVARAAALAVGAINAPIEAGAQEFLLRSIPGLNRLGATGVRNVVKQALLRPTVRAALLDAAKSYGTTLGAETGQEVAQRAVTILAGELAKTQPAPKAPGQLEPGNVDLYKQPKVVNADGSVSTVDSLSVNIDGREVLLPTVTAKGEHFTGNDEERTRQAINEYQRTGRHLGVFQDAASATAFAKQLHEDFAGGRYEQGGKFRDLGAIAADLMNEAAGALQSFALGVLPGPLLSSVHQVQRARVAERNVALFTALGEGATQSKTLERAPEAARAFLEHATKDGPVSHVYAPVDTWTEYWQSKGVDPADIAAEVTGSRDAYAQAVQTGEDLKIPTGRYAVKLAATEHNGFFAQELRLQPGEMNGREVEAFKQELAQQQQEAEQAPANPLERPVTDPIRQHLLSQLEAAGFPLATAESYATLYETAFAALGERAGVAPAELFARYGLQVGRTAEGQTATPPTPGLVTGAPGLVTAPSAGSFEAVTAPLTPAEVEELDRRKVNQTPTEGVERRAPIDNAAAIAELEAETAGQTVGAGGGKQTLAALARDPTLLKRGAELRRQAMAAPRQRALDIAAQPGETAAGDTGTEGARAPTGAGGRAAVRRVEASAPPEPAYVAPGPTAKRGHFRHETEKQQTARRQSHYADVFAATLENARAVDPAVDVEALRKEFTDRVEMLEDYEQEWRESGKNPRVLLEAIAEAGGLSVAAEEGTIAGNVGELKWIRESRALGPFGSFAGVRGVFQTRTGGTLARTGLSLDDMVGMLRQDARFAYLEDVNDLLLTLEDIARVGEAPARALTFPGTAELARRAGMNPAVAWWQSPAQTELGQQRALFEPDEQPKVDTLDTGEQQPRLPGDVGEVRTQEVATPAFEAPFSLTSEVAKPKGKQTTLFQPGYHGSPHVFEAFSLHAIGSGEGAQAYGWGLYFAGKREIADYYREELAGKELFYKGREIPINTDMGRMLAMVERDGAAAAEQYFLDQARFYAKDDYAPERAAIYRHLAEQAANTDPKNIEHRTKGRTYTVEIPNEQHYLDWDKRASEQSPEVRAVLQKLGIAWEPLQLPTREQALEKLEAIGNGAGALPTWVREASIRAAQQLAESGDLDALHKWWTEHQTLILGKVLDPTGEDIYVELKDRAGVQHRHLYDVEVARFASLQLSQQGVVGIKYLDGSSRASGRGTSNYVVFDDKLVRIVEYDQRAQEQGVTQSGAQEALEQTRRGAIRFGPDRQFSINLFANADLSTFLHESGHFFLEVLRDLGNAPQASAQIKADLYTLDNWFFTDEDTDRTIGEKQHEQFARAFEAYLMEGQAPSIALRPIFARFRAWLVGIYRALKNLNVTLTPEVRDVFDRLLATDEAIAEARAQLAVEPMFTDARAAGMTAEEFAAYRGTVANASREAQEQLQAKLLGEVQRERTAQWKTRREELRLEVERDYQTRPEFQALYAIQRGTYPNGEPLDAVTGKPTPMELSRQAIVDEFGDARLKTLPRPYVYTVEGGMTPAAAAEIFGYSSGDELLTALATAGNMKARIDADTDRRMIAEHGSMLLDGSLAEQAQAAVANEGRDQVVRAELLALANLKRLVAPHVQAAAGQERRERDYERRWLEAETKLRIAIAEGRKDVEIDALQDEVDNLHRKAAGGPLVLRAAVPPADVIASAAEQRIGGTRIRDLQPQVFWAAARKAAQQALEAAAAQDFDAAIGAQQRQLLNLALYRKAEAAIDDAEMRVRQAKALGTAARRALIGKAGQSYLDQIDGVLERYEFATVPGSVLERRAGIRRWVAALEGENLPVDLPDELLDEARRVNYSELTYDELVGVTDGLQQIVHLAQLKNRMLRQKEAREYQAVRDGVVTAIDQHGEKRPGRLEFLPKEKRARRIESFFASHMKLAEFVARLDGYVDGGPVFEAIMRPINEAATRQQTMHEAAAVALKQILTEHYRGRDLAHLHDLLFIPAIGASLSREARLAVALNWGNEGNRQRLMESKARRWNAQQVQAILDTLDERDLRFVQATLEHVNSYWDEIAAKQRRVFGIAPEKVPAASWRHSVFGEQRGGYYPIAYDGRLLVRQGNILDADAANLQQHANYAYATTKRGYTKAREERVNAPIRLELGVVYEHVEAVIHDLTHHEMLIDVGRLLGDAKVQSAMQAKVGDLGYRQIREALLDVALGLRHSTQDVERAINWVKNGTTLAGLGWNLWTSVQQPLGVFNGMARIGPVWVAKGIGRMFRDASSLEWSARWVSEKSEMMRLRGSTLAREVQDLRTSLQRAGSWFDNALRRFTGDRLEQEDITSSFLWVIEKAQRLADLPVWIGAYEKYRAAGEDEGRAVALADQAVLDSQSGGQLKDLAKVQRGGPALRLFTTFYSYGNLVFNQTARTIGQTEFRRVGSVGQMLGNLLLIYAAPAAMTVALARAFGKEPDDDGWLALFGRELLATAMNTMVLVRELSGAAQMVYAKETGGRPTGGVRGYEGPTGVRIIGSVGRLAQQVSQGEADRGLLRATEDVAGILFHLPLAQVQRTIDGFVALEEGRTKNPAALFVGAPPKEKASAAR